MSGAVVRRNELHQEKLGQIRELKSQKKETRLTRRTMLKNRLQQCDYERSARIDALAFAHWIETMGYTQRDAAKKLDVKSGTLAGWQRRWNENRLHADPTGRPAIASDRDTRNLIVALFYIAGPGIGMPALRGFFPDLPKGELEDMLRRYRQVHLSRNKVLLHVLRWHKPGTVWAIDFFDAPLPIDGLYPYVFVIRDLASGNQLLALPVKDKELARAANALTALIAQHGAPLVVKSDCGFASPIISECLDRYSVFHLLSPPYTPQYNAAIEAGIGSLKTRAHHEAARHGHPTEWNCDDVEAARLQANELARPWGHNADTPDIAWIERQHIDPDDRAAFATKVSTFEQEERQEKQRYLLEGIPLGPREITSARRVAVSRALVAHGLLSFRRKRFTLPIKRSVWSNVS